jgi:HAD superfamily hydrolase (TIGR01490 family)
MRLALFDLDHTLIPFDSGTAWFRFLMARGVLAEAEFAPRQLRYAQDYLAGRLDVVAFQRFCLAILARYPRSSLETWRAAFRDEMAAILPAQARALVAGHQARGDLCCIVTATNDFVARAFADAFGIHHLVATRAATLGDDPMADFSGDLEGSPSFGAGKVTGVHAWLATLALRWEDFSPTCFYSDSVNDLPLLEAVSDPVAVLPDARLHALARARGWRVADTLQEAADALTPAGCRTP